MKTVFLCRTRWRLSIALLAFLGASSLAFAATNDATAALQQGLFEEEANHNLPAAMQQYQAVIGQFEKERQLAATAVFRLGECYRKQGDTNAANSLYQRVLREFSDQTTLANLSRSYLAGSGQSEAAAGVGAPSTSVEADEVRRIQAMIKDSPDLINALEQSSGLTPLHKAAQQGQLVVAQFLLANGADVNAKSPRQRGRTALHLAAEAGHKAMVDFLLSRRANVQARDADGATPLHLATEHGFRAIIETLLEHGAEVNARTDTGTTPLHEAVANGYKSIAEVLLAHGADVNVLSIDARSLTAQVYFGTPLHIAVARGDDALTELLVTNRANPNLANNRGETPLQIAAENGSTNICALLISHNADVNARNRAFGVPSGSPGLLSSNTHSNWTALSYGVNAGYPEIVALLLTNGADPNARFDILLAGQFAEREDGTALLLAAYKGYTEVVELLLKFHADPNLSYSTQTAPLFACFKSPGMKRVEVAKALVEHGADVNIRDNYGQTPLLIATRSSDLEFVRLLVANKADVNAGDNNGQTPLMLATGAGQIDIVKLLLAHKADVNARSSGGAAALHYTVGSNSENAPAIAELLLAAGADPNIQDNQGRTPDGSIHFPPPPTEAKSLHQLAEVLEKHGGVAELPDFSSIRIARPGSSESYRVFQADTNGLNHFTVLESIANFYLEGPGAGKLWAGGAGMMPPPGLGRPGEGLPLRFPDFARAKILRPVPGQPGQRKAIPLNLLSSADAIDCAKDVQLEFGDLLEIPEREHPLSERPVGLTTQQKEQLQQCLHRKVTFVVKGQTLAVDLDGGQLVTYLSKALALPTIQAVLRSSSDLSRVRIKRNGREITEDVLPFWNGKAPLKDDLWLRDGDTIEIMDKA